MPDRVLQNHYCVAALQHRLAYNGVMSISSREQSNQPVASARRAGLLAAACAVPSAHAVVVLPGHGVPRHALAFVNCMRTHGEPKLPDPVVHGNSVHISITPGSGVDPRSARFTAAFKACKYLTSP